MSKSETETSMGVDTRGEMFGSTPSPIGDRTSGECGLAHSLKKNFLSALKKYTLGTNIHLLGMMVHVNSCNEGV